MEITNNDRNLQQIKTQIFKTISLETAIEKVLRVTKEKIVGLKIIPW